MSQIVPYLTFSDFWWWWRQHRWSCRRLSLDVRPICNLTLRMPSKMMQCRRCRAMVHRRIIQSNVCCWNEVGSHMGCERICVLLFRYCYHAQSIFPHCGFHSTSKRFPEIVLFVEVHWSNTTFRKPQRALEQVGYALRVTYAFTVKTCSLRKRLRNVKLRYRNLPPPKTAGTARPICICPELVLQGITSTARLGAPKQNHPGPILPLSCISTRWCLIP